MFLFQKNIIKPSHKAYKSFSSIFMYLGFNIEDYWHIDYKINPIYNGKNYFWDISKKAILFNGRFDNNGIYLYEGSDGKQYYSVINLAQYALGSYEEFIKTKNKKWLQEFINHCDWLVKNQEIFINCEGVWINKFPVPLYNLSNDWSSALGQAFGISALTRAFWETKKNIYLDHAIMAYSAYMMNINEGGVLYDNGKGFVCLEEYTSSKHSSVLNGYISAIWSIYDLYFATKNKKYFDSFCFHCSSLSQNLNRWDKKFWSKYDLWEEHDFISSYFYHKLHIKQLQILYKITEIDTFNYYAKKWERYRRNILYSLFAFGYKVYNRIKK